MEMHTSTAEWKSYENRIRQRRAERLVQRASAALAAGRAREARECLAEAHDLAPTLVPEIDTLGRRPHVWPAAGPALRFRQMALVAASPLFGALVVVAVGLIERPAITLIEPPAITRGQDYRGLRLSPVDSNPKLDAAPAGSFHQKADTPRRLTSVASAPHPVEPADPRPAPAPTGAEDIAAVGNALETLPVSLPLVSTATADVSVRSVIDRYTALYNAHDAAAGQRASPGDKREGPARRVSLGKCQINIIGSIARASCAGSTTSSPRTKDGTPHSDPHRWTFDLARAGRGWRIVTVRIQNP
jgi:hypothetical protein